MISVLFEMKCSKHPAYTGQRQPRTRMGCFTCELIWQLRRTITHYSKKYTIQHVPVFDKRVRKVKDA